jgi:transcriptional regulator with XRE-family HTH domain
MATRERPGTVGAADARHLVTEAMGEIRAARRGQGLSLAAAGRRAGISGWQLGRLERGENDHPTLDQVCRAARAVQLRPRFKLYPDETPVRDEAQLALLARFEELLAVPLRLLREVTLPIPGDLRAWDGRITDGRRTASIEAESKLDDVQAVSRRIALKDRDDPGAGVIILVLNRTAHNRRVLEAHREALRAQFPLDGAVIARNLRRGRVPPANGIILL